MLRSAQTTPSRSTAKHSLHTDVLIDVRPVHALPTTDETVARTLCEVEATLGEARTAETLEERTSEADVA